MRCRWRRSGSSSGGRPADGCVSSAGACRAPQSALALRPRGSIAVSDPQIVTPSAFTAQGSLIAYTTQAIPSHGGLRLWELVKPPRFVSRAIGLQANGDIYGNRRGTLLV